MAKFQQLETAVKSLDKEVKNLTSDMQQLINLVNQNSKSQAELAAKTNQVKKTTDGVSKLEKERLNLLKRLKEANSDRIQTNEELKLQLQKQKKTNKELAQEKLGLLSVYQKESKRLRDLKNDLKNLIITEGESAEKTQKLAKEVQELDKKLKGVDATAGDFQRNVGNYPKNMDKASESTNIFNTTITNVNEQLQEAPDFISGVTNGIGQMTKAALKFIATPLGAILAAIAGVVALVTKAFKRSEDRMTKLRAVGGKLSGVFNLILKALEPVADFIINNLIVAFDALGKAWDKTIGFISKGLDKLGFDKAAEKVDNFSKKLEEAAKSGERLVNAEAELIKMQRLAEKTQLDFQKQAEKLRQIRDDESLNIFERIKANEELGKVLSKQLNEELIIANKALEVSKLRIDLEGETTANLDERAEALTRISDIQERIAGQESEQLVNINSLLRERAQLEKEFREGIQKENDAALKSFVDGIEGINEAIEAEIDETLAREEAALQTSLEKQNRLRDEAAESELERFRQLQAKKQQIEDAAYSATQTIITDQFNARQDERLAKFQDSQKAQEDALKNRLDKGVITEAQYEKQLKKIRLKTRQEEAKAEKKKALFDIAINTALGIVKTIGTAGFPAAIPLIVAVGAIGAVQAAVVASKPIPKFKTGTKGKLNEGTFAVVGDGYEHELITTPDGSFLSDNKPQTVWLPKNSEVFSGADTKELMQENRSNILNLEPLIKEQKATRAAILSKNSSATWTERSLSIRDNKRNQKINYIGKYIRGTL